MRHETGFQGTGCQFIRSILFPHIRGMRRIPIDLATFDTQLDFAQIFFFHFDSYINRTPQDCQLHPKGL